MYVKPFDYVRAGSLEAASGLISDHGPGARVVAGGQSLMPMLNLGVVEVDVLVDITAVPGLDVVSGRDGRVEVGALSTHRKIELDRQLDATVPLLVEAARHVGNIRVRNVGTLGGSLAHNDPSSELALAMTVLEADYRLAKDGARRSVLATEFGVGSFETVLGDAELIESVTLPVLGPEWGWGFREFSYRPGDFAVAAAAAVVHVAEGVVAGVRLGVTGLGGGPIRCREFEVAAGGAPIGDFAGLESHISGDFGFVMDGVESSEYRAHVATVMASRALSDAVSRSNGVAP